MNITTPPVRDFEHLKCVLLGPPKVGKTTMAATMSKFYPADPVPEGESVTLKDMLWLPFDNEGTLSLRQRGITVPTVADLELARGADLAVALAKRGKGSFEDTVHTWVETTKAEGLEPTVVADTISTWSFRMEAYLMDKMPGDDNRWPRYQKLLMYGSMLFDILSALPCHVIWVCHTKKMSDAAKDKAKIAGLPGSFGVTMNMAGASVDFYRNNTSLILPVVATVAGKGQKPKRFVYPSGNAELGIEGGGRFSEMLDYQEPADFRHILKKLRGGKV